MTTKKYFTLRFEHSDGINPAGLMLRNADNTIHIGQIEGCHVRLPNATQYEDAEWAVIERTKDGEGWQLTRTSPYAEHEVRVNGEVVTYVRRLQKGDRISFASQRQELLFDIRDDGQYTATDIMRLPPRSLLSRLLRTAACLFILAVIAYVAWKAYTSHNYYSQLEAAKRAVVQVQVDSIQLLAVSGRDTIVVESCRMNISAVGFISQDTLITARHCIEPWLNIPDTMRLDTISTEPQYVRMALKAETHEAFCDDSATWVVVSYCSIWRMYPTLSYLFSTTSTSFVMNKERDLIVEMGDFDHCYVWRSMSAVARRTDQMLGDIAWLPVTPQMVDSLCGGITRSQLSDLTGLTRQGSDLIILGSPEGVLDSHEVEVAEDKLRRSLPLDSSGFATAPLAHNGEISPGFSGGPVLAKTSSGSLIAIGVISVTDKKNANRCYSVPTTEINRYFNTQ